jgi:hypothetical protein
MQCFGLVVSGTALGFGFGGYFALGTFHGSVGLIVVLVLSGVLGIVCWNTPWIFATSVVSFERVFEVIDFFGVSSKRRRARFKE